MMEKNYGARVARTTLEVCGTCGSSETLSSETLTSVDGEIEVHTAECGHAMTRDLYVRKPLSEADEEFVG